MIYQGLLEEVCRTTGRRIETPQDFDYLSVCIFKRMRVPISVSTLKRVFGYVGGGVQPSRHTLNLLARYVGYEDYEHFCVSGGESVSQSQFFGGTDVLRTETISVGARIRLTWRPDRVCVVRYLGDRRFEVEEAQQTKLSVGDVFSTMVFINYEPLYLDIHSKEVPMVFVAGKKDGIMYELLE